MKKNLRSIRLPILFIALYLSISSLYLLLNGIGFKVLSGSESEVLTFLAGPFNFLEDFSNHYSSATVGFYLNAVLPVLVIFFALVYFDKFAESKRVKPEVVYVSSIVASYLVSLSSWLTLGLPTVGTSIIAFSMTFYLFLLCFTDFFNMRKKKRPNPFKDRRNIVILPTIVLSYLLIVIWYLDNSSVFYRLLGGLLCGTLVFAFIYRKDEKPFYQKSINN